MADPAQSDILSNTVHAFPTTSERCINLTSSVTQTIVDEIDMHLEGNQIGVPSAKFMSEIGMTTSQIGTLERLEVDEYLQIAISQFAEYADACIESLAILREGSIFDEKISIETRRSSLNEMRRKIQLRSQEITQLATQANIIDRHIDRES